MTIYRGNLNGKPYDEMVNDGKNRIVNGVTGELIKAYDINIGIAKIMQEIPTSREEMTI